MREITFSLSREVISYKDFFITVYIFLYFFLFWKPLHGTRSTFFVPQIAHVWALRLRTNLIQYDAHDANFSFAMHCFVLEASPKLVKWGWSWFIYLLLSMLAIEFRDTCKCDGLWEGLFWGDGVYCYFWWGLCHLFWRQQSHNKNTSF